MWILWKMRFWNCEFSEKLDFQNVIFLDKMRIFAPVFFPYLSARMNMDPLWSRQVPLLLIWFLEIFKGCGNPEWYQVPSQLGGNWHCCCGVVKPILINAKHMTARLRKLSMFSCAQLSPEIDSLKASYKKALQVPVNKVVNQRQVSTSTLLLFFFLAPFLKDRREGKNRQ